MRKAYDGCPGSEELDQLIAAMPTNGGDRRPLAYASILGISATTTYSSSFAS